MKKTTSVLTGAFVSLVILTVYLFVFAMSAHAESRCGRDPGSGGGQSGGNQNQSSHARELVNAVLTRLQK